MRKRILSILLVVVMCFTMMPTTTFAAESAEHEQATEIPEAVCTCGTDDQAIHATNCPAYVAPENPACSCVEKCPEDSPNLWCDICGFDVSACQGEDTAVVYASVTSLTFNFITIVEGGEVKNASGDGWNYDSDTNTLYITADVTGAATTSDTVLISKGGGLNINVASGTTLTLNADRIAVRLAGDSTISGGGTVALTGGETQAPLWVEGSLGISDVALTVTSKGDWAVRSLGAITLKNVDAQFTGTVEPANGATYYPVSILGNSVISINQGKLKASDLTLSVSSHLKVWKDSGTWLISSLDSMLPIPVNGGYYRTSADGTFAVDSDDVTLDVEDDKYFEYIGANHVGEAKPNNDGATHSKSCTCSLAAVVETGDCEGGEATCSAKAVCATCNTEYGELAAHSTSAEDDKAATCTAKAYCSVCEGEYGEVNPGNHAGTSYTDGFRNCCGESEPATGSGTEDAPYQISNTGQLLWFAQQVNSGNTAISGKLMNNIDLSGVTYTPIGTTAYPYVGTFDGQGFRVKNMTINTTAEYQGLFGAVSGGVHIKNVIIDASCSIKAGSYSAALVGGSNGSGSVIIENCGNEASVNAGQNASGIFGVNMNSSATVTIRNCYNTGNITASKDGGGISGWIGDVGSSVTNCWSSGVVTGGDSFARGRSAVTYTNCYHLDSLTASASTGINTFTAEELENGALAYKLGVPWGQTIGTNNHPVLNGKVVYYGYISCGTDAVMVYSNNSSASEEKPAHTGGAATCKDQAVCDLCKQPYGDLSGHTWDTEGVCTVCSEQAVAQLTSNSDNIDSYYTDLQTAVDAAENQSGSTLTLLDNVTLTNGTSIAIGGGTFTFDLAGHTITFAEQANNVAIKVSAGDIIFTDSGDSGSVVVPGTYTNSRAMVISGGMVTIDGGSYTARNAIDISEGAALTVNDGTITAASKSGIGISNDGTLNIHGGSIHTNSVDGYGCAISLSGSCTATITGGAFTYTGTSGTNHLFRYSGGNLDLTNYSNLDGLTFSSGSSSTTDVTNVKLPDGYVFLDKAGNQTMTVTATSLADRILTIRSLVSLSNVTISFAAAEGGGTMESESISSGEPYTLPENGFTAPEGMKFKAWKVGDDTTEYQPGAEISVTTDTVITAVWEDITYKITYAAGEGSGTMDSGTAMYGVAFTLPNCTFTAPSAGYEFKAWLIGGAEYTAGETYTFTEDTTVTAVWQIATSGQALVIDKDGVILGRYSSVTAAVTVAEANNGSTLKLMEAVTLDSPIYIESGTFTVDINGQSVTVSNSVFNVSGTAAITFTDTADSKGLVTSNSTGLSAAIRVYGGTAVIQNGVYAGPSSVLVTSGGTATINGGTFNNKLYNDGGTLTVNDTTAQDVTIENSTVAVDTIVSGGAITEVSFNGGTLSFKNHPNPAGIEVYYNASVTEIPLPAGYYFTDENGTVTTAFATGKTYTIRASEGLNTVSFDANGGTGTMASIVMEQGDYTLPACGFTAPEHYIFRTWQIGDDEYAPGKNITVSADVSVKAVWQPVKYTVTFNANGGGSTMDTVSVDYGAAYTLPECTFTAPDGKEFREWLSGNVRYAPGDQITITGDTLVAAVWDTASFDIIFDANGGSGTMTTDEVNYGTAYYVLPSCAFTAPNGMEFDCWKIGDTTCAPGDVVEITENITITAQWKTHTHNWNEGADGSVTCSVCSEQAVAQLTALSFSDPNDVVSYYTNLQAALDAGAALTGYGNIKLLDNVTGNFTADGPIGNIDLNGKTITAGSADAPALKITDKVDAVYPCIFGGTIQSSGGTALEITGETSGSSQFFFGSRGDPFANIEDNPLHLSGKTAIKASSIALNLEIGSISATENAVVLSDGATVSFSGQTSVDLDGAKVDFAIEGDYTDAPLSFDTINMPGTVYTITMENPGVFAKPGTFASLYEFQLETNMFTSAMEGYVVAKDGDNLKLTKGITEGMVRNTPSGEYNGSAHTVTADQFTVVWTDTSGTETTLTAGTDYDIRLPAEEMVNAGDYTITIVGKGDYIGEATGTFTIGKAAAQTLTGEIAVTNGHAYEYTFDLSGYKPTGEDVSWGDSVTYTLDTVSITESGYYTNNSAKVEGNTLTLPINEVESTATDSIGTVTVKITSQNFEESTLTLTINRINMSNEDIISVDISWGALSFTYTDGAWNPDTHSYGEGGWTADGNIVTVSNSGTATVSATLSYENTAGYSFTGTFDTASSTLAAGENKTFTLTLSGKPAESMTAAVIGTVTVKIEEGGE